MARSEVNFHFVTKTDRRNHGVSLMSLLQREHLHHELSQKFEEEKIVKKQAEPMFPIVAIGHNIHLHHYT
jgi:hypothetical protein